MVGNEPEMPTLLVVIALLLCEAKAVASKLATPRQCDGRRKPGGGHGKCFSKANQQLFGFYFKSEATVGSFVCDAGAKRG